MGLHISSIDSIPNSGGFNLIFIEKPYGKISTCLSDDFFTIASSINKEDYIIDSLDRNTFINSIHDALQSNHDLYEAFERFYDALGGGLLITKPRLQDFRANKGEVFMFIPYCVIDEAYISKIDFLKDLIDFVRGDSEDLPKAIKALSSPISSARLNPLVRLLLKLNKYLELKPNCFGIGLNLNTIIDGFFYPSRNKSVLFYKDGDTENEDNNII